MHTTQNTVSYSKHVTQKTHLIRKKVGNIKFQNSSRITVRYWLETGRLELLIYTHVMKVSETYFKEEEKETLIINELWIIKNVKTVKCIYTLYIPILNNFYTY